MANKYSPLLKHINYNFQNEKLLELALSHRSVGSQNNERLEFLGDAIINFIIAGELFARYPKASEGQLTRMRAQLVCAEMLTDIAKELSLGKYVILGAGEQRSGGHQRASILADALEAIFGAIYLDTAGNMAIIKDCVLPLYQDKFNIFEDKTLTHKDPKTILQELLQAQHLELPEYTIIRIEGEKHDQTFYVQCTIPLLAEAIEGVGNTRRKAEQMAAEQVLVRLNANN